MVPEDYDQLISDPTDYLVRTYLPRTVGAFAGFGGLSSFFDYIELPFVFGQVLRLGQRRDGGRPREADRGRADRQRLGEDRVPGDGRSHGSGLPAVSPVAATKAPFDILGDTLRGTKGVIVDMFRYPEKVLAACDRLVQVALDWPLKKVNPPAVPHLLHPAAQGRRRLHERRAVPYLLLADAAEGASSAWWTRA